MDRQATSHCDLGLAVFGYDEAGTACRLRQRRRVACWVAGATPCHKQALGFKEIAAQGFPFGVACFAPRVRLTLTPHPPRRRSRFFGRGDEEEFAQLRTLLARARLGTSQPKDGVRTDDTTVKTRGCGVSDEYPQL